MGEGLFDDPRTIVAIAAATISFGSAALSAYLSLKSGKLAATNLKIARFNAEQSERSRLHTWAQQCMDEVSSAYILARHTSNEAFAEKKLDVLAKLTSLIDRGRWLLPNEEHESHGKHKDSAYTGFRQEILDHLVDTYDAFRRCVGANQEVAEEILTAKRRFTSSIQEKLEPRVVEIELKKLVGGHK